jgi:hypothetical protein
MSRCRRDSFYLAPGLLCYFKDHTLATWDPETGNLVRFFHRSDVAAFARRFPAWDGVCMLAKSGGLAVLQKMLHEEPNNVQLWRLDARLVEGRRPADACSYVMHRWAVEGDPPGGARSLIPLLFPSTEPLHKGLRTAALHAIGDNAQLAVHVVSAAWQAGLFKNPAQAAALLRSLAPLSRGVLVEPDPRLVSMLASGLDPANVDLKSLLTELANPHTHMNPAAVSLMLDLNAPFGVLRRLELSADANLLERIWSHRNYPREEYLASVRRAVGSNSEEIRRCAASRPDLPDELLFEFAASKDPDVSLEALRTLRRGLLHGSYDHPTALRWAADDPQLQAERRASIAAVAAGAWTSGDVRVRQLVLELAEMLDSGLLSALTDELLGVFPPLDLGEDTLSLYATAALSRCKEGSPITEETWAYIKNLVATIPGPAGLERWRKSDLHDALRMSVRDSRQHAYTSSHELTLYYGLDPSALTIPQHVADAVLSSKLPSLIEALASNPHLGHETTRKLIEMDSDGSLTRILAQWSSDHDLLRALFARDTKLAKLVAKNPLAPRDVLLAVAADKATYDAGPHKSYGRDEFGTPEVSTYEEVMRNRGLGGMTLDELEGFLAAQRGDGTPRARDDVKALRTLVYRTADPSIIRLAVASHPELWLDVLDLPRLPADMRQAFITAASSDVGGSVGLSADRLSSVLQNWLARTKTVSNDELWSLAGSPNMWTRCHVAQYQGTPPDLLEYLAHDREDRVWWAVLRNPNTPSSVIDRLCGSPATPRSGNSRGATNSRFDIRIEVARRDDLNRDTTWNLAADTNLYVRSTIAANTTVEADLLRQLAAAPDHEIRASVAGNKAVSLDLLLALAKDGSDTVRRAAASNPNLPESALLVLLKDASGHVVQAAAASCYDRRVSVPTELLCTVFDHPHVVEEWVKRGRERSWWWTQDVSDRDIDGRNANDQDGDVSPLVFAAQMLDYEDPKVQALLRRLLDTGSFNADPDMHECVSRLLNLPLPLRLQTLEEQRRRNIAASEPVGDLDDLGLATVPYPMEGLRAELTERLAACTASEYPEFGLLSPRVITSPSAQRRNGNYMGNCTFSYYGPDTLAGRKMVVGFYGEGSNEPVLNALLCKTPVGWSVQEVNSRFNRNVTYATAVAAAAALDLPLHSGPSAHKYLP